MFNVSELWLVLPPVELSVCNLLVRIHGMELEKRSKTEEEEVVVEEEEKEEEEEEKRRKQSLEWTEHGHFPFFAWGRHGAPATDIPLQKVTSLPQQPCCTGVVFSLVCRILVCSEHVTPGIFSRQFFRCCFSCLWWKLSWVRTEVNRLLWLFSSQKGCRNHQMDNPPFLRSLICSKAQLSDSILFHNPSDSRMIRTKDKNKIHTQTTRG